MVDKKRPGGACANSGPEQVSRGQFWAGFEIGASAVVTGFEISADTAPGQAYAAPEIATNAVAARTVVSLRIGSSPVWRTAESGRPLTERLCRFRGGKKPDLWA
jgi:hypothetical protein